MPTTTVKYKGITFDSIFEREVYKLVELDKNWSYHTEKVPYTITYTVAPNYKYTTSHTYSPDFIFKAGKQKQYIEAKGRFWTKEDIKKVQRMSQLLNNPYSSFWLLLQNPRTKVLGRKNLTMADWCNKYDINYLTYDDIKRKYGDNK